MAKIPISGAYAVVDGTITFTPTEDLPEGTLIEVTLFSAIRGTANQRLATSHAFSFTTATSQLLMYLSCDSLQPEEEEE